MLLGFWSGLKNLFFGLTMNGGKNKVITIKCTCIPWNKVVDSGFFTAKDNLAQSHQGRYIRVW